MIFNDKKIGSKRTKRSWCIVPFYCKGKTYWFHRIEIIEEWHKGVMYNFWVPISVTEL